MFSFNFQTFPPTVCSFFTTFLYSFLSMSSIASKSCNSQRIFFTSFKHFLLFLLIYTKSISVPLSCIVCYFSHLPLLKSCVCHMQLLFIVKLKQPSFLKVSIANSISFKYIPKTINSSTNMSTEVLQTKNRFFHQGFVL